AADLSPGDLVLEVGPGTGTLTEGLLDSDARVVAVELDEELASLVQDRLGDNINFRLVRGDCLKSKHEISPAVLAALAETASESQPRFRLVANLPYQAASPLVLNLLLHHPQCSGLFVTIQKEVADRILAGPGSKTYGTLSIICRAFSRIERIANCPPSCFWPQPKITSSMLALRRRPDSETADINPGQLSALLQLLFSKRRKQLGSILGRDFPFPAGITPTARPEQLTVEQLIKLSNILRATEAKS
ncbi:MAG TPA: ribosomal RNA small subunit methyltransferase A, partial [Phycisphaeraceae bacterium]|nr:ribosomal RNA small subunit methyltransferase A [Phycisphaeraceae bacterium]